MPEVAKPSKSSQRNSLEVSIQRVVLLPAAVVLLAAVGIHFLTSSRLAERSQRAAAIQLANCVKANASLARFGEGACADWYVDQLLVDDSIRAVAMWSGSGERLAVRAVDGKDEALLKDAPVPDQAEPIAERVQLNGKPHRSQSAFRVDLPLGVGDAGKGPQILSAVVRLDLPSTGAIGWLAFVLPVTVLAVAAMGYSRRWLRIRVIDPLRVLSRSATTVHAESNDVLAARTDELGQLAQALDGLREESTVWREHAWRVERRMDSRIAERTRTITRDLQQMQREVWTDSLTGVKNRRLMQERLPALFSAQQSAKRDLTVVMLDLDHFKKLNDSMGHSVGDEVLAFAGELLRQCTRPEDIVVRYGGDEFALILPGVSAIDAAALTERILTLFKQRTRVMTRLSPAPSMTAGIASLRASHPANHRELVRLADQALYTAKHSGKGGVHIFGHADAVKSRPTIAAAPQGTGDPVRVNGK